MATMTAALTANETAEYDRLIAKMEAHRVRWEWIRAVRVLKQGRYPDRTNDRFGGFNNDNESSARLIALFNTINPDNDQRLVEFLDDKDNTMNGWSPLAIRDCEMCVRHHWAARMYVLNDPLAYDDLDQRYACYTCYGAYYIRCTFCDQSVRRDEAEGLLDYGRVCRRHITDNEIVFITCDVCGHRNIEGRPQACHHDRGAGSGDNCVAPHLQFEFPANGKGNIAQDEPYKVTIPGGEIDSVGLDRIAHLVYDSLGRTGEALTLYGIIQGKHPHTGFADPDVLDATWQAKNGNYTKRLSRLAYKRFKLSLPDGVISQVGNIAQEHTSPNTDYEVTVTRDINLPAIEFGNEGSCWWGGFGRSRCAFKQNGGMALRAWGDKGVKERILNPITGTLELTADGGRYKYRTVQKKGVVGRAWVLPLLVSDPKDPEGFVATDDCMIADAFMVFNPYGIFTEYLAARIVAHMTDKSYKKLSEAFTSPHIYINNYTGVLVADQEILNATTKVVALKGWKHP